MESKKTSIVILTWNGLAYTEQCLDSLKNSAKEFGSKVYVVDNGSTDGTKEYLKELDWIQLIDLKENIGFVRGNNLAINQLKDEDIILLNNDIIITQQDWLLKLQQAAYSNDKYGIAGCRLKNEKNELLHAGTYILKDTLWGQQIGGGQTDIGQYVEIREVEGIVFACAYIKNEVIKKLGGLNEAFFSYFEDTDYCLRAKQAGYKIICCGNVTLIHYQNVSTDINNVSFSKMFLKSQKTFKKIWGQYLSNEYKYKMTWHSVIEGKSGYAVSARNFMTALEEKKVDIRYRYAYGRNTPIPYIEKGRSGDYRIDVLADRKVTKDIPQVSYCVADVFYRNSGKYKIGYTMLETTGIPKSWVDQCNKMNEIWVPSHFNKNTFAESGVSVPIHVIPLGVDCNFYNPQIVSYKKNECFTFLSVFEWGERKAPEILLKAFVKAFSAKDNVVLLCKINNSDASINVEHEIRKMQFKSGSPKIIFLYNIEFNDYEMPSLYRTADCFVTATRGEGWGMPILEAMACGLPTIAPNWSAQTEFFNGVNGFPVNIKRLVDAKAKCKYYEGFKWAEADEEHLIEQMRFVFKNRDDARKKGIIAAGNVRENWTWENAAEKIIERLDAIK